MTNNAGRMDAPNARQACQVQSEPGGWSNLRPASDGFYFVRGWDEAKTPALVTVSRDDDGELRCNLHERNSDVNIGRWLFVDEMCDAFEWMPLTKACAHCNGRGMADEGDPEVGSAPFDCDHCFGTGSSEVSMLKKTIATHFAAAHQPPAGGVLIDAGLSIAQEPKYTVRDNRIVNRASGEAIPDDEPVFIIRARDLFARDILEHYLKLIDKLNDPHKHAVLERLEDFSRFADEHRSRMKLPDTARPQRSVGHE